MTYSIVARDPVTGELGVAVQTRWFNVGSGVPWAEPRVGAIATQSYTNLAFGPDGLARLRAGRTAGETLAELLGGDDGREIRQVGIVDASGRAAAHTGARCVPFAGHLTAPDVSVQANMMERPTVPAAMLAAFGTAAGDLADRLVAALLAAEAEGGDARGRQSAALLVVPGGAESLPWQRSIDLRVDDAPAPLDELRRLLRLQRANDVLGRADDAFAAGDRETAGRAYAEAVALAPEDDQIAVWAAVARAGAGDLEGGLAMLAAATAAEPRWPAYLERFAEAGPEPAGIEPARRLAAAWRERHG